MRTLRPALALILVLGVSRTASAIDSSAGTGGASFLKLGQGSARAQALGHAFVALAEGSDSLISNPAGLALTQQRELSYSYMSYVQNLDTPLYLAYAHPLGRTVFGGNVSYISDSGFDVRDANGIPQPGSNVQVHDGFASIGMGRSFWYEKFFLGGALRGIHEDNAGNLHDTIVGDVGAIVKPSNSISVGFAVQNFGSNRANVAEITRGGAAIRAGDFLTLSMEISKAADSAPQLGIGAEFGVPEEYLEFGQLTFRAGYYTRDNMGQSFNNTLETLHLDKTSSFSFGFGLYTSQAFGYGLGVDYAFVPLGALGSVDQISLKLKF